MLKSCNVLNYVSYKIIFLNLQNITIWVFIVSVAKLVRYIVVKTKHDVVLSKEASILNGGYVVIKLVITLYVSFLYQIEVINFMSVSKKLTFFGENFKFNVLEEVGYNLIGDN